MGTSTIYTLRPAPKAIKHNVLVSPVVVVVVRVEDDNMTAGPEEKGEGVDRID